MNIRRQLYFVLLAVFLTVMTGSAGYFLIFGGKPKFIDCVYMTVISLTSVGYGEILPVTGNLPAQIYTMSLIVLGMGVILYGISTLTAMLIEGKLSGILRRKQMEKQIAKLKDHYIVCGVGETGRHVLSELIKNKEAVVLIEQDEEAIGRCLSLEDLLYVKGDATDDENLITAGIERAAGIIICLPSDKDVLYVTMTARMLNKKIRIISSMINPQLEAKLKKAGADKVVSPNYIGGLRMASEMIRPTVVDFLDSMLRSKHGNIRIHEIRFTKNSPALGKAIRETGLQDKHRLLILGIRQSGRETEFNPPPNKIIEEDTMLIVMGNVEDIASARKAC
ncbi:MAG: potassium channel protein [Desulfobacteraceae bacterium]|nr:MAG: potassium channel protein [Desulfobacteraceae bacterium]